MSIVQMIVVPMVDVISSMEHVLVILDFQEQIVQPQ